MLSFFNNLLFVEFIELKNNGVVNTVSQWLPLTFIKLCVLLKVFLFCSALRFNFEIEEFEPFEWLSPVSWFNAKSRPTK